MRDQKLTAGRLETTAAQRAEELGAANHFLDSMIENIPNMIFVKDAKELRFVRLNRAGEDLLGFTRDELMGRTTSAFFQPGQPDNSTSWIEGRFASVRRATTPKRGSRPRTKAQQT